MNKTAVHAIIMVLTTILAKVLGFCRELSLAFSYGASNVSDAYVVAFTLPTILFSGLGTAMLTSYISVYTDLQQNRPGEEKPFHDQVITMSFLLSVGFIAVFLALRYPIVRLFALGFEGAEKLDGPIVEKIWEYRSRGADVIFTRDTHRENYLETQEGRRLPVVHCIEGSHGHKIFGETAKQVQPGDMIIDKPSFGSMELAKAAMDIVAKHVPADKDGVRIAELDEQTYRQTLWGHTPLTDFWRVGRGYERRLQKLGLNTMGDIALCSCGGPREYYNEDLLYKTFGVNAELLIDHAWGWEPTTIADIKAYKPESSSLGSGQVLTAAYPYEKARLVVREMAEELILNLVDKGLVTDQIDLTIGYDTASLTTPGIRYTGPVTTDHYGRKVPKHAHGTRHLGRRTQSAKVILDAAMALFDRIVNPALLVRRVNIVALHILVGQEELPVPEVEQLDLFTDYAKLEQERLAEQARLERESRIQQAALSIKRKFGKNALVKGMDLQEDATAMTRNNQIGGHKA